LQQAEIPRAIKRRPDKFGFNQAIVCGKRRIRPPGCCSDLSVPMRAGKYAHAILCGPSCAANETTGENVFVKARVVFRRGLRFGPGRRSRNIEIKRSRHAPGNARRTVEQLCAIAIVLQKQVLLQWRWRQERYLNRSDQCVGNNPAAIAAVTGIRRPAELLVNSDRYCILVQGPAPRSICCRLDSAYWRAADQWARTRL